MASRSADIIAILGVLRAGKAEIVPRQVAGMSASIAGDARATTMMMVSKSTLFSMAAIRDFTGDGIADAGMRNWLEELAHLPVMPTRWRAHAKGFLGYLAARLHRDGYGERAHHARSRQGRCCS
jgi:hypothetical protein